MISRGRVVVFQETGGMEVYAGRIRVGAAEYDIAPHSAPWAGVFKVTDASGVVGNSDHNGNGGGDDEHGRRTSSTRYYSSPVAYFSAVHGPPPSQQRDDGGSDPHTYLRRRAAFLDDHAGFYDQQRAIKENPPAHINIRRQAAARR